MEDKPFYKHKCFYLVIVMFIVTLLLLVLCHRKVDESSALVEEVEFLDSTRTFHKLFYSSEIESLKNKNAALYDSLREYKEKVNHLLQFTYEKEYDSGKVIVAKERDTVEVKGEPKTFEYESTPTDTLQYKLAINADSEPNWYSLHIKVKETFTIVNKEDDGANHLTIETENKGNIRDVTAFEKKLDRRKFVDRLSVGPAVTVGYDPFNRNFGMVVGVGVAFDLW